jgi:hypothetical protein
LKPGRRSSRVVEISTANSGMRPTSERTCSGVSRRPQVQLVVVEAVLLVPQPVPPSVFMASAMATKCSKNFEAMSS